MYYAYLFPLKENEVVVEKTPKQMVSATTTTQPQGSARSSSCSDAVLMHEKKYTKDDECSPKHQKWYRSENQSREVVCYAVKEKWQRFREPEFHKSYQSNLEDIGSSNSETQHFTLIEGWVGCHQKHSAVCQEKHFRPEELHRRKWALISKSNELHNLQHIISNWLKVLDL